MSGPSSRALLGWTAAAAVVAAAPGHASAARIAFLREKSVAVTMAIAPVDLRSSPQADSGLAWRGRVTHPTPVNSIRLHVVVSGGGSGWRVVIRSDATSQTETYEPSPASQATDGFWTGDIAGAAALVDLVLTAGSAAPQVVVDRYAYSVQGAKQQAIYGIDGRLKIADASPRVQKLGVPVVRLRIMIDGLGQATCTGFLASATLLFTNEHCVASPAEARSTLVDFGFEKPDIPPQTLRAVELMAVSHDLDYALLRLEKPAPATFTPATIDASAAVAATEQLLVIEHPLGGYKQVSIETCEVSDTNMPGVTELATDFGHRCDTLNGSSGSPVMDFASGHVVGLHHFGFDLDTNTLVNRAVRIDLVVADVKRNRPDLGLR